MVETILVETECVLCGARSQQPMVSLAPALGLPDLDSRPAEQARSALPYGVQRCPECNYCATDISLEYPEAEWVARGPDYQKLLRRRSLPEKAREFLAWSLIELASGEFGGAGWSALRAAWVCDDAEKPKAAVECRQLALERFLRQRTQRGHITALDEPGLAELVLADLYRRTEQYNPAARWARQGLAGAPAEIVRAALEMELALADDQDPAQHSLEELPGISQESPG